MEQCTRENAQLVADKILVENGYDLAVLSRELLQEDGLYTIEYSPKDVETRGGGAEIIVSKKDCTVMSTKLYQ